MADSDDYYDDLFELDDAALAAIQATEERFGASLTQAPPKRSQPPPSSPHLPPSPPPPKRLKTAHGWVEPVKTRSGVQTPVTLPGIRRAESVDENPEILLSADGSYSLNARSVAASKFQPLATANALNVVGDNAQSLSALAAPSSGSHLHSGAPKPPVSGAAARPSLQRSSSSSHVSGNQRRTPPAPAPPCAPVQSSQLRHPHPSQVLPRQRNLVRRSHPPGVQQSQDSSAPTASQARARIIERTLAEVSANDPGTSTLQAEVDALRAQLAKMNAANAAAQQSLREAQDAQFIKAGEVSNLRRTIDKTTREHAEAMAKAKADIQAAEKVKAELQTKLKEEADRMATRLVFKQHEMETSVRKPVWGSARSRRVAKDIPPPSSAVSATPTRTYDPPSVSRMEVDATDSHAGEGSSPAVMHKSNQRSGEVKQPAFKGFQNAFMDSGPVVARSPKGKRGKMKGDEDDLFFGPSLADRGAHMEKSQISSEKTNRRAGKEVDTNFGDGGVRWEWGDGTGGGDEGITADGMEEFAVGKDVPMEVDGQIDEEFVAEEGFDWGEELRRIIFTHVAPRADSLTLHALLSTSLPPEMAPKKKQAYAVACQVILETCGAKQGHVHYAENSEWEADVVDTVASALVTIGGLLSDAGCITPLTALLDLLTLLTLYIPAFTSPFLGPAATNNVLGSELDPDGPSQLLCVLGDIVRDHLIPLPGENKGNAHAGLAMAVVHLMESVCWNVKDGLVEQLSYIFRQPQVLETLLHPSQAPSLVTRTIRLLVLLATHKPLFRSILSFPETGHVEVIQVPMSNRDWSRIPTIERLCHYLIDPPAEDSHLVRRLIITLITLLLNTNADALTILLDSASLAPSIVVCITKLSRLLWEGDLDLLALPGAAKSTTETLYLSLTLLHRLVFVPDSSANLGRMLIDATRLPGPFNGVTHMFIVTFGRLSWAEPPDWLDDDCKDKCEIIAELAMEIIETVVAGPECDSLWAVWHQDEEIDDEEAEALDRLVGTY